MKQLVMFVACTLLLGMDLLGQTVTLFSDDFESYTASTNLAGQGGWTGCGFIPIGTSSVLLTKVVRADLGSAGCSGGLAGFAYINHSFPGSIGDNVVTTLSFDAYAPTGSNDAGVFLTNFDTLDNFATLNGVVLDTASGPVWQLTLYKNGDGTTKIIIPGGTGAPVSFKVVIDVPKQILYVIYDFGGGPQTTSSLSLAGNTTLNQWKTLSIFGDYRFGSPQDQIDNIRLTQTPRRPVALAVQLTSQPK